MNLEKILSETSLNEPISLSDIEKARMTAAYAKQRRKLCAKEKPQ